MNDPRMKSGMSPESRERRADIWKAIRKQRRFSKASLKAATGISERMIQFYLTGLTRAGYLSTELVDRRRFWTLVKDTGIEAPLVAQDGRVVKRHAAHENLWRTMKMLRTFTPAELAGMATTDETVVSEELARSYCARLAEAGYLGVLRKARKGVSVQYRFARDTGPTPPQIVTIKTVYDPNLKASLMPGQTVPS